VSNDVSVYFTVALLKIEINFLTNGVFDIQSYTTSSF